MGKVIYNGIKFHSNFKLLFKGFSAITLFGQVFTRKSTKELEDYLTTYGGQSMANHEHIHILQAHSFKLRWFTFYIKYLAWWVYNLFAVGFSKRAYYEIPFEKEAYANQDKFEMNQPFTYNETHWKDYK